MGILSWIIVGALAGGLGRMATGAKKRGCLGTIAVGIIGALVGGALWRFVSGEENTFTHFGLGSIFVAFIGACIFLLLLQAIDKGARGRS